MHELGIAQDILSALEEALRDYDAVCVSELTLGLGAYAAIEERSLSFCLEALSPGTPLEGATINFIFPAYYACCPNCGPFIEAKKTVQTPLTEACCPQCNETTNDLSESGVYLQEIQIDGEEDHTGEEG